MTQRIEIRRLPTGVPGLDDILGGGLPEFSFNLIAGPPGCGKTTLAHQMMFALASPERPALYLTVLGEPPLKMLRYQQQFDFFDTGKINGSIHFVNLAEEALAGDFDRTLERIVAEVVSRRPSLVFIDSFRSVVVASETGHGAPQRSLQHFMQQLGVLMTSWQATTFLIGEYFTETDANPVFTVADGLIWLRQCVQRNSMVRKIEIMKMRGQPTLPGLHSFRIERDGLHIFAPVRMRAAPDSIAAAGAADERRAPPRSARVGTGNATLDDMLDGGIPRGYSVLVAGPSGSGKSILAAGFLIEGARQGETGVLVAFEQHPDRSRNPQLAQLLETGKIGLVQNLSGDVSIDEVVQQLVIEVRRLGATRVVIDSLSGFELVLAPTFRDDFRESLLRMVTALASEGTTVLMTSELEDRYTDLRFSPYGTAFLTDAIIVQRYIEVDSRLRRVLAVVKVRASAHSDQLREYTIDESGLHIGAALVAHEGLLGGRPSRKSPPAADAAAIDSPRREGEQPPS